MKLSRGSLIVILIALIILLVGVVQVIARGICDSRANSSVIPRTRVSTPAGLAR
ncbi:MAG: hypothetical protein NTU88_06210 [Armatimonadetes bacterium]|nr:hypothetical protein [Armatimonadota bacterium]